MLAVYVVYLLYLCLRAFGELRAMNFLDTRWQYYKNLFSWSLMKNTNELDSLLLASFSTQTSLYR